MAFKCAVIGNNQLVFKEKRKWLFGYFFILFWNKFKQQHFVILSLIVVIMLIVHMN